MASLRQQLDALIEELSPAMEKAFREAIEDIKSEIVLKEVVERLERRDVEGAIAALHIDPAAFRPLSEAIRTAFNSGGLLVSKNMPRLSDPAGGRVVFRWDVQNQRAEQIIREASSTMITHVTEDTKQMARERIEAGYAKGQGPNTIALDIAGRVNRVTGRREGGLLGMTSQLARTVENARTALLSGDVEGMKHYLTLTRRDKRFDRQVAKAIREGKPLPADAVQKITGRLADRYVQLRAQTIARTETQSSVHAAKHEAYQQGLDRAGRDASLVTRRWRSVGDGRVRHTHQVLNAEEVTGMDLPFQSPSGAMMRFPGDTSLGAGAAEIIGCRCHVEYNFDFAEEYARSRGR
ncbi:phage minor head protein [Sinorhizobium medicae]|nr:head morphogenesis protein [Sinorhizobium medicae]MDX0578695.1 head morphogenesis protein [Sinorhizobium medicae]MDX0782490.1 head morphogenesis protein [Sinorhizobium medicae]MDX1101679.1 head morphogenesis protein [Sinorhizobium medicae]